MGCFPFMRLLYFSFVYLGFSSCLWFARHRCREILVTSFQICLSPVFGCLVWLFLPGFFWLSSIGSRLSSLFLLMTIFGLRVMLRASRLLLLASVFFFPSVIVVLLSSYLLHLEGYSVLLEVARFHSRGRLLPPISIVLLHVGSSRPLSSSHPPSIFRCVASLLFLFPVISRSIFFFVVVLRFSRLSGLMSIFTCIVIF